MVSNLHYYSFKTINLGRKVSFASLLLVPLIIALISIEPPLVLFLLFFVYAISGPLTWWMARRPSRLATLDDEDEEPQDSDGEADAESETESTERG